MLQIIPRSTDIKEQSVRAGHVAESFGDILTVHRNVPSHTGPLEIPAGELVELLPRLERVHMPRLTGEPRQRHGQASGTSARFNDRTVRPHAQAHADVADILGVQNLRLPFHPFHDIVQRRLLDTIGNAERRTNFGTERGLYHFGHLQHAVLRVHVLIFLDAAQAPLPLRGDNDGEFSVCRHGSSLVSFDKKALILQTRRRVQGG